MSYTVIISHTHFYVLQDTLICSWRLLIPILQFICFLSVSKFVKLQSSEKLSSFTLSLLKVLRLVAVSRFFADSPTSSGLDSLSGSKASPYNVYLCIRLYSSVQNAGLTLIFSVEKLKKNV